MLSISYKSLIGIFYMYFKRKLYLILSLLLLQGSATANEIQRLWQQLDQTQNKCQDIFDYYPEGGMLIFYCHAKSFLNFADIQKMAAMPIFLQGPHKAEINSQSSQEFGHYNPVFVQWLIDNLLPSKQDHEFILATQNMYDNYVRQLARTYFITYIELTQNHALYFQESINTYQDLLQSQQLPVGYHEDFHSFADLYQQGYERNVVKGAVGFWIRRSIDGTIDEFYTGLNNLLSLYDAEFLHSVEPKTYEINNLIDIWSHLNDLFAINNVNCETERTWLPEYGMRGFYCHLKSALDVDKIQQLVDMPIFLSGPHYDNYLNLYARFEFGHYNPKFVRWLGDNLLPKNDIPQFVNQTKYAYSNYIEPLARTYYLVYRILKQEPLATQDKKQIYIDEMANFSLSEFHTTYKYFNFASEHTELANYFRSDYEVASAVTFWLRRMIDGTDKEFINILQQVLMMYDADFVRTFPL